jgi:hypothetical protein
MSSSGRINSRRAKEQLVELLYRHYRKKGPEAHRKLDSTHYKYQDLRIAYLKRLQEIHPDKNHRHQSSSTNSPGTVDLLRNSYSSTTAKTKRQQEHDEFVRLQHAWQEYDKMAKTVLKAQKDSSGGLEAEANFTKFGVGCSFSDSPEEQKERDKIMEQASRGFFYSGLIPEKLEEEQHGGDFNNNRQRPSPILDETIFAQTAADNNEVMSIEESVADNVRVKKSLVDMPKKRRTGVKWQPRETTTT